MRTWSSVQPPLQRKLIETDAAKKDNKARWYCFILLNFLYIFKCFIVWLLEAKIPFFFQYLICIKTFTIYFNKNFRNN